MINSPNVKAGFANFVALMYQTDMFDPDVVNVIPPMRGFQVSYFVLPIICVIPALPALMSHACAGFFVFGVPAMFAFALAFALAVGIASIPVRIVLWCMGIRGLTDYLCDCDWDRFWRKLKEEHVITYATLKILAVTFGVIMYYLSFIVCSTMITKLYRGENYLVCIAETMTERTTAQYLDDVKVSFSNAIHVIGSIL